MFRRAALLCFAVIVSSTAALADQKPNTLSPDELNDGWILLFDGETTFGWKANSDANWKIDGGVISVDSGAKGLLNTTTQFGDFALKLDFRADRKTNSGVFLRTSTQPSDPAVDCYELNIAAPEVSPFFTGSFVGREEARETSPSSDWRTFHVEAVGGHFRVSLDGEEVLDYVDEKPLGRGYIGLQFNSGKVEFRNIKLKPLSLESIFNGKDLAGWKEFPGKKSKFSVTPEGEINVKNGNGQLEYQTPVADFVLQLEIISNGQFLNSGIFFRNIPGEFWQGYESQIQNGYLGSRTVPIDYGTGAFYRRQKARKVVPDDFQWFHKTLVVEGPHMATWVNGYQVTDWTDTRDPHENPRNGLRLEAGTITIQGHDPTTDLSFRDIALGHIPPREP
ncbi:MAG: DUF1080 domain-containing protein [Planctomycetota bacterium]|nr:MAG: DUF1080 domain-containing protein [Planctomycetota bacterium]